MTIFSRRGSPKRLRSNYMSPCVVGSHNIEEQYAKQVGGNPIVQHRGGEISSGETVSQKTSPAGFQHVVHLKISLTFPIFGIPSFQFS